MLRTALGTAVITAFPSQPLQIVAAVVSHEKALKAQAKKMNVESLRSNEVQEKYCCGNLI